MPPGDACVSYQTLYGALRTLKPTFTSTFISRTISCFPARSNWNKNTDRSAGSGMSATATRIETQVGPSPHARGDLRDHARAGGTPLALAHALHHNWSGFHAPAGNVPGRLEPAVDQRPPQCDFGLPGWMQAHGHAQIFGWIGTFILGIGFYSIPKLRRLNPFALSAAWLCWALWTSGVALRWLTGGFTSGNGV